MVDIKNFIDDLGIDAFETNIKIAGVAIVSDSGRLVFQTDNWDISNQTKAILKVIKGEQSIVLNGAKFLVTAMNNNGIIASNESGMGHTIFVPFQGGVLVSYAMPQADTSKALDFLKGYALKLNGKL
ncbi:MAG: hypothetical protein EAX89_10425 [Candidatus Lokiarchaeota archaeon]|nr:hypothetical protein [Candidatus Lokiarchaeota archaeon]